MSASSRFFELQQRFVAGLERRLGDLIVLLDSTAEPEALSRMFHSLAGIGGTYGFPDITTLARQGEESCRQSVEELRPLLPTELNALRALISSIAAVPTNSQFARAMLAT
ncbi:MAG TPA: Hpt domain-containing protein [Thermoanaerobaculia bacterium]|nr:Hpt domain-containing protein [Thermoanaerobaculia bacterium]